MSLGRRRTDHRPDRRHPPAHKQSFYSYLQVME